VNAILREYMANGTTLQRCEGENPGPDRQTLERKGYFRRAMEGKTQGFFVNRAGAGRGYLCSSARGLCAWGMCLPWTVGGLGAAYEA